MNFHPLPEGITVVQKQEVAELQNVHRPLELIEDTILKISDTLFVGFSHRFAEVVLFDTEGNRVSIYGNQAPLISSLVTIAGDFIADNETAKEDNETDIREMPPHDGWGLSYNVSHDYDDKTVVICDLEDPEQIYIPHEFATATASAITLCLAASHTKKRTEAAK